AVRVVVLETIGGRGHVAGSTLGMLTVARLAIAGGVSRVAGLPGLLERVVRTRGQATVGGGVVLSASLRRPTAVRVPGGRVGGRRATVRTAGRVTTTGRDQCLERFLLLLFHLLERNALLTHL